MKQRFVSFILHPYVIAFYITLAILLCLPDSFSKYEVSVETQVHSKLEDSKLYHHDFDGDGISERIEAQTNTLGNASFLYYHSNGDYGDQINFSSKWPHKNMDLWFSDIDNNGKKELFLVTQRMDSAFLHIIDPFSKNGIVLRDIFVDSISEFNDTYNFDVTPSQQRHGTNLNNNEVIFNIHTGFAGNPRHIYKYDFNKKQVLKSPHLVNSGCFEQAIDIDNDGRNEILFRNHASANNIDSIYTHRLDKSTWLQVLDDDLRFLFEPIEFNAIGGIYIYAYKKNGETKLMSYFRSNQKKKLKPKLMSININGHIEKEMELPFMEKGEFRKVDNNRFALFRKTENSVIFFDSELHEIRNFKIPLSNVVYQFDILNDEAPEWVILPQATSKFFIYDSNFENPISFSTSSNAAQDESINVGLKLLSNNRKQIFIQKGIYVDYVTFTKNPLYYFQYGIYLVIYVGVLGLVLLVLKGQRIRDNKRRAIEKQISELQIKTIKNQVDPHFVFNAINTISEMTLMDNKLEADKFIGQFSHFMRDTLQHSDKITTTLKAELEYTENFIKLQQIRFNNKFQYSIDVDNNVNLDAKIPKHVLFTYVENAIKHGLALKDNGLLSISALYGSGILQLYIEDNGIGIRTSQISKKHSTGNGLRIMEDIFKLYSKLNKKQITHRLIELKDDKGNKQGVKVEIKISNK
ncbi:hypothetical protein EYD45_01890 [Hyunsoonleella flava]|uniref:Signal transduction histidine kinase internal region domain-containing protein n=1 Tax=Hyunsoonleella flava TaxID=2527939 RepID=A0A4Q9FH84_9FLAO|nr:histidine kinase [Hyunsoonleella flava]TBN06659.1 hypothetical protein EYD45_01890 [Hyunsoonleella flava]